ncbi:TPM domain-containing protein [Consotaella aegiceratis]|uniref:TPM domain-containing protein n=1 Tax=Consotaella aegiceratis TaxID=3097961 RepID=UPI002F3E4CBE
MVTRLKFAPEDHERIAAAIRQAEAGTSGEIFAVFAHSSDGYRFVSGFFATILSLAVGLVLTAVLAFWDNGLSPLAVEFAQIVGAALLILGVWLSPDLRMLFVPAAVGRQRAHRLALAQFLAHNIHGTEGRTGVLLFVSEAERYAEVVADTGISGKVAQEEWDGIVNALIDAAREDRLAEGFAEAAEMAGLLLTQHFPADDKNPNEIPDRLVEI